MTAKAGRGRDGLPASKVPPKSSAPSRKALIRRRVWVVEAADWVHAAFFYRDEAQDYRDQIEQESGDDGFVVRHGIVEYRRKPRERGKRG